MKKYLLSDEQIFDSIDLSEEREYKKGGRSLYTVNVDKLLQAQIEHLLAMGWLPEDEVEKIKQSERERMIKLFKEYFPCMPDMFGHGCDQDDTDCSKCSHITSVIDDVEKALKDGS